MKWPKITKQKGIHCQKDYHRTHNYLTEILYLEKEVYLGRTFLEVANAWDHCDFTNASALFPNPCKNVEVAIRDAGKVSKKSMKLVT